MAESERSTDFNYTKRQIFFGVVSIFAVYSCMSYSAQTLGVVRPKMAAELNGMPLYDLAVSIPGLFSAFATLIFGKFSDMYGRRVMLMITMAVTLASTVMSALAPSFVFLIVAGVIGGIGSGAMMTLTFAVVGDLFPMERRGKWIGLLNIPVGVFSLVGPTLGGWVVDNPALGLNFLPSLGWRYLYWVSLPLMILSLLTIPAGVPSIKGGRRGKIDVLGSLLVFIASSATITGFSLAGSHPWVSLQVLGLLAVALAFWVLFIKAESRAEEPVLDPRLFRNRSFLTVSLATFLSGFGQMGMLMYFLMFLQGVQQSHDFGDFISSISQRLFAADIGATAVSGMIITPMSVLMAFISVPVGFIMGRSKHFKWIYVVSYTILTVTMAGIVLLDAGSSQWWSVLAAVMAGVGLGSIPPLNTLVVQKAVPQKLLGVSMGAFFFCLMLGSMAIAPAVLGTAQKTAYEKELTASLPAELKTGDFLTTVGDSKVLLNQEALEALEADFAAKGDAALFPKTVQAIRDAMAAGVRSVFMVCAVTMLIAFLLICTLSEKPPTFDLGEPTEPSDAAGEGR
ncbi:MAG: MFS transporter [Acidobacteriota bacterium]|jgi:MFS family permease|nr:MFS transporter [Acidobacteriota bacterium]